jgi:hypothetical protein
VKPEQISETKNKRPAVSGQKELRNLEELLRGSQTFIRNFKAIANQTRTCPVSEDESSQSGSDVSIKRKKAKNNGQETLTFKTKIK